MKENREEICRFCLKKVNEKYFGKIDQMMREILNVLYVKIDLDISEDPITCTDCADDLINAYNFKSTCIHSENHMLSFISFEPNIKISIQEVYLNINGPKNIEDKNVCRFCMNLAPSECSTLLSKLIEDMIVIKRLLEEYFPEVDLYSVKEPIICEMCLGSLYDHLTFTRNFINVEEKVQSYIKSEGVESVGKIDLSNVQQLLEKSELKMEVEAMDAKECYKFLQNADTKTDLENEDHADRNTLQLSIKNEIDLKVDENDFKSFQDTTFRSEDAMKLESEIILKTEQDTTQIDTTSVTYKCDRCIFHTVCAELYTTHMIIHEDHSYVLCSKENDISGTRFKSHLKSQMIRYKKRSKVSVYKCNTCSYKTKLENDLKQHRVKHKQRIYKQGFKLNRRLQTKLPKKSSVTGYKCENENYSYETRYKSVLKKHNTLTHNTFAEVAACKHESLLHKITNTNHVITRKDPLEVTKNKCENESCLNKKVKKNELLVNEKSSEITVYNCENENCSYKTAWKGTLKVHMLVHKNPSEVTMYKCENENCSFKTKWKSAFKTHLLVHKKSSNVTTYTEIRKFDLRHHSLHHKKLDLTVYKCEYENCSYKTTVKPNLKNHILIHKNPSELTMYKCEYENCSFKTKWICSMKNHIKTHQSSSELIMYRCEYEDCLFETKWISCLRSHVRMHKKSSSQLPIYKCEYKNCLFKTKRILYLESHIKTHKNSCERTMYKCDYENCSYEAKLKSSLTKHTMMHKNPLELTAYKCDYENCLFETKKVSYFKIHMLLHKNLTELTTHKCEFENCLFETTSMSAFKFHSLLAHKKSTEIKIYKCGSENCLYETKDKHYLRSHTLLHKSSFGVTRNQRENCSHETSW